MEETNYLGMKYAKVSNKADFFKGGPPEMIQVKNLYEAIKILFNLPSDRVEIEVVESGARIYRFTLFNPQVTKNVLGWVVYIPFQNRLDIYTIRDFKTPLIQFRNKKPVWKNYSIFLDRAGFDKLFNKLINVI